MKILFEAVNGKKGFKEFKSLKECKCFVLKNKKVIKEAQIMEGPLGSGGWTPKKAYNQFKKGHEKVSNINQIEKIKDSYNKRIQTYLIHLVAEIAEEIGGVHYDFGIGYNKHGYYIFATNPAYIGMKDEESDYIRNVNALSDKYNKKIYMPKLTKYIETHKSLPSEKQLKSYLTSLINNRYKQNLEKQKNINPERHISKTDVEDF